MGYGLELSAHSLAVDMEVFNIVIEREGVHDAVMLLTHFEGIIAAKVACCLLIAELISLCEFSNDGYDVLR